jgi:4-carboxymuconolactone decarboxylase
MARLPDPIPGLAGEDREIYDRMLARRTRHGAGIYGLYVPLLHNPQLAAHIEDLGYYYKYDSKLPRDRYQFVVLAFARAVGAEFEYRDHVEHARRAGVPDEVIAALDGDQTVPEPYATYRRVVRAALAYDNLPTDIQDRVIADVGAPGLVEVVTLCGFYTLIAMVNAAFDVSLDEAGRA